MLCVREGNRRPGVALACVTDFSDLSAYGLKGYEREMSTPPMLQRGMVDFTFYL